MSGSVLGRQRCAVVHGGTGKLVRVVPNEFRQDEASQAGQGSGAEAEEEEIACNEIDDPFTMCWWW